MAWVTFVNLIAHHSDNIQDVELNRLNPAEPKLPMFIKDISAAAKKRLAKNGVHVSNFSDLGMTIL